MRRHYCHVCETARGRRHRGNSSISGAFFRCGRICRNKNCAVCLAWIFSGEAKFKYFKLLHIVGGTNAENITTTLKTCLANADPDYKKKLVSASVDGASVMLGVKAGVTTLMRKETPWMMSFHCICHRLALGAIEAAKKVELCKDVESLLRATAGLFSQCGG